MNKSLALFIFLFSIFFNSFSFGNIQKNECSPLKLRYGHQIIGQFGICQPKSNDKIIFFKLRKPFLTNKLCFIPTHERDKKSFYLGEPRCLFTTKKNKIYKINFLKNRPGLYEHLKINGTMIIPDRFINFPSPFPKNKKIGIPEAYLKCLEKIDQKSPDSSYCKSFKEKSEYIYMPLK